MSAPALTPALALDYLSELSTDIHAGVLLGSDGAVASCSEDGEAAAKLGELALELFERASGEGGEVHQIEVSTGDAGVYAVREHGWTIAVVTGRFALPSLMFYDLRTVLSGLQA